MSIKIFISYKHQDCDEVVTKIVEKLQNDQYKLWLDKEKISIGDCLTIEIEKGILESDIVVCFLTNKYVESKNCRLEFFYANDNNKTCVYILLEAIDRKVADGINQMVMIADGDSIRLDAYKFKNDSVEIFVDEIYSHLKPLLETEKTNFAISLSNVSILNESLSENSFKRSGDHPDIADSLYKMAVSYSKLGDEKTAVEYYKKTLEMRKILYIVDHPDIAQSLYGMAVSYERLGNDKTALEYHAKCLEMRHNLYENDHPDVAISLNNISILKERLSKNSFKRSGFHLDIADSLYKIAVSYSKLGDEETAVEYYKKTLEMRKILNIVDHPDIAQSLYNIGVSYERLGNDKTALEYHSKCLEMRHNLYENDHPDVAISLNNISILKERLSNKSFKTTIAKEKSCCNFL
jgi:tetratricopeptide (TPR) repeat protein